MQSVETEASKSTTTLSAYHKTRHFQLPDIECFLRISYFRMQLGWKKGEHDYIRLCVYTDFLFRQIYGFDKVSGSPREFI